MKVNSFLSRCIKRDLDSRTPISDILCNVKIYLKKIYNSWNKNKNIITRVELLKYNFRKILLNTWKFIIFAQNYF